MAQMIRPQIGETMADFACGTGGFLTSWLRELEKQVKTTDDREQYGRSVYGIEKKQFPYMLCITNMLLHGVDVPQVYHDNSLLKDVYNTVHSYGKTFGVSPSGNIDNNRRAGVDVDTWLANTGYIDYICPQIYWSNAYGKDGNVTMYSDRLAAWKGLNKAGIRMYIGLAAYRCGEVSKYDPGWSTRNTNLSGQVREMRDNGLAGYVLFSYSSIVSSKCSSEMSNLRALNQ